jgi:hypothetical protein
MSADEHPKEYTGCPSDWIARDHAADEALLLEQSAPKKKCKTPAAAPIMTMLKWKEMRA